MSEIADRMKKLDEQHNKIISQAIQKNENENGPPPSIKDAKTEDAGNFPLGMFILFLLMGITIVTVVVFASSTIDKMAMVSKTGDQLEVLLDEHVEEFNALEKHVKALEFEFRGAFRKDREQMALIQEDLIKKDVELGDQMRQLAGEIRTEVLKYKSVVTDNESSMSQVSRKYDDLMIRFNQVQEEFKALRAKVVALTAPSIGE